MLSLAHSCFCRSITSKVFTIVECTSGNAAQTVSFDICSIFSIRFAHHIHYRRLVRVRNSENRPSVENFLLYFRNNKGMCFLTATTTETESHQKATNTNCKPVAQMLHLCNHINRHAKYFVISSHTHTHIHTYVHTNTHFQRRWL